MTTIKCTNSFRQGGLAALSAIKVTVVLLVQVGAFANKASQVELLAFYMVLGRSSTAASAIKIAVVLFVQVGAFADKVTQVETLALVMLLGRRSAT